MCPYALGICGAGVIADENCTIEAVVNALHHSQRTWPGPHNLYILAEAIDQEVLAVAVRIAY